MYIRDEGKGAVTVLLHGCPSTTRCFEPLVAALVAQGRRVLVPDLPGYGKTPPFEASYDWAAVGHVLAQEIVDRGCSDIDIVGFSGGAYRAFQLATLGTVHVNTVFSIGGLAGIDDNGRASFRETAQAIRNGADFRSIWLGRMAAPAFAVRHPEEAADVIQWLECVPREVLADELEAFARAEDLRPRLRDLDASVVARVGELDAATPPAFSEAIVASARHGELQRVPGCGHALLYEDREATTAAVLQALGAD